MNEAVEASAGKLKTSEVLYTRISKDILLKTGLELSADIIQRSVRFHTVYPVFPEDTPLTFTHYLSLTRITDNRQRLRLEQKAIKQAMSSAQLKKEVSLINMIPDLNILPKAKTKLSMERGEPYIYKIQPYDDLNGNSLLSVDCGFKIHLPVDGHYISTTISRDNKDSRVVRSYKTGTGYDIRMARRKESCLYTYVASIIRVVDGDTFDCLIDVGFGIQMKDRIRLKGINTPELPTQKGKEAKQVLTEILGKCPRVIMRTRKSGNFGRWLGDVFALPGCADPVKIAAEGEYVNQMMMDKGLAEGYR